MLQWNARFAVILATAAVFAAHLAGGWTGW